MHIDRIMAGLRRQGASAADAPSKLDLYTKLAEAAQQCSLAAWKQAFPRVRPGWLWHVADSCSAAFASFFVCWSLSPCCFITGAQTQDHTVLHLSMLGMCLPIIAARQHLSHSLAK